MIRSSHKSVARVEGFTLVEVMCASLIGGFVVLVAVGSLNTITQGARRIEQSAQRASEMRYVMSQITEHLNNIAIHEKPRSGQKYIPPLVCQPGTRDTDGQSDLVLRIWSHRQVRRKQPEGGVHEVEYFMDRQGDRPCLMQRLWPNPDSEKEKGGIQILLAEDVVRFEVRLFDGENWTASWPETMTTLPSLAEVKVTLQSESDKRPLEASCLVTLLTADQQQQNTDNTDTQQDQDSEEQGEP